MAGLLLPGCTHKNFRSSKVKANHGFQNFGNKKHDTGGNSLEVQWLGLRASTAGDPGSIPGQGIEILQAARCSQNKTKHMSQAK